MSQPYTRLSFHSSSAPAPNGNYSHAILQQSSATLHIAGWMGDETMTGKIVEGGVGAQTRYLVNDHVSLRLHKLTSAQHQAMRNIKSCLEAANSSLEKIVRRRIYMIDIKQFREVDAIWAEWVGPPYPVSTCVQIGALAKEGALVEIEVLADA
ncbi:hypothetical protein Q7P35_006706 [Cladosporium inversicolor]